MEPVAYRVRMRLLDDEQVREFTIEDADQLDCRHRGDPDAEAISRVNKFLIQRAVIPYYRCAELSLSRVTGEEISGRPLQRCPELN